MARAVDHVEDIRVVSVRHDAGRFTAVFLAEEIPGPENFSVLYDMSLVSNSHTCTLFLTHSGRLTYLLAYETC